MKLEPNEKDLLESVERGEWKSAQKWEPDADVAQHLEDGTLRVGDE